MVSWLMSQLNAVTVYLSTYELPFIFILGNFGNITNILLFSRRRLRYSACSYYFICLSIVHLVLLDLHGIPRVVATTTQFDVTRQISAFCKIRSYIFTLAIILSRHYICSISIDRWLVTSPQLSLRQLSSAFVTRWNIISSFIFWCLFTIHALVGFDSNLFGCSPSIGPAYTMFYFVYGLIASLSTLAIMALFSVLTVINVRLVIRRAIAPSNDEAAAARNTDTLPQHQQRLSRDAQLIRLSILQVIIFVVLNLIWTVFPLISFFLEKQSTYSDDQVATVAFLGTFGINLVYVYASVTFILYSAASKTYRKELVLFYGRYINAFRQRFRILH